MFSFYFLLSMIRLVSSLSLFRYFFLFVYDGNGLLLSHFSLISMNCVCVWLQGLAEDDQCGDIVPH